MVRVDVAFTPGEAIEAPVGVVVDVLRATSTIAQALDAGFPRVLCCLEIDDARAVRDELGEGLLGASGTPSGSRASTSARPRASSWRASPFRSSSPRRTGRGADIEWCARESVLRTVPRHSRMVGPAAEIVAS